MNIIIIASVSFLILFIFYCSIYIINTNFLKLLYYNIFISGILIYIVIIFVLNSIKFGYN
jgi:hypothetical protein